MNRTFALVLAVAMAGIVATAGSASSVARSGTLHVTKECSQYDGTAGSFCTITSSNIAAIRPGMRVVYASALSSGGLDSDLTIDGPGNNRAYGHVVLDLSAFPLLVGEVTLSGGTGEFAHFHAGPIVVVCDWAVDYPNCSWDGTYSFGSRD
ncbi:MAG TPA: hypothetical protein VE757_04010 [Gaiellaceae bacterium]|jgi:hypothetical protein|nr:hypothetical protein [Gaiellaceae bacterium]